MLKKLAALAGATALAGTGITLAAAAPAHAAAHPAGSIFIHGTSKQGLFPSRATCDAHAKWMVGQVAASTSSTLIAGVPGYLGPELRTTCYPVRGGSWAYLTAYTSTTGVPVLPTDLYVDMSHRLPDLISGAATVDTENVWAFEHSNSVPAGSVSMATCNGWRKYIVNEVLKGPKTRLVGADTSCVIENGTIGYIVDYATTSPTAGLRLDTPLVVRAGQPMLDRLGYDYPLAQTIGSQLKSRYLSKDAVQTVRAHGWLVGR